jgi:hypothetical protein
LHKKFRHFRIGLSPAAAPERREILSPTFNNALRVWWVYS